jgi:hypothetical protein
VGFIFWQKRRKTMTDKQETGKLSLDFWAVLLAFVLAIAVRFGFLPQIPW